MDVLKSIFSSIPLASLIGGVIAISGTLSEYSLAAQDGDRRRALAIWVRYESAWLSIIAVAFLWTLSLASQVLRLNSPAALATLVVIFLAEIAFALIIGENLRTAYFLRGQLLLPVTSPSTDLKS